MKREIYGSEKCDSECSVQFSDRKQVDQQKKERTWQRPIDTEVRVIDFGGATYDDERHTLIINTRQYRAPEVILENLIWNETSDIWSMACIMLELYTGELFFDTRKDIEHLAMIEKQCGPIPRWMAEKCTN